MEHILFCEISLVGHKTIIVLELVELVSALKLHLISLMIIPHPVCLVLDSIHGHIVWIVFSKHGLIEEFLDKDKLLIVRVK